MFSLSITCLDKPSEVSIGSYNRGKVFYVQKALNLLNFLQDHIYCMDCIIQQIVKRSIEKGLCVWVYGI